MSFAVNTKYEILTPSGWQYFSGIKKSSRSGVFCLKTKKGKTLKATNDHKTLMSDNTINTLENLKPGDGLFNDEVMSVSHIDGAHDVYDPINVSNGHLYYSNGLVSKNCSFIRDFDEIWTALNPTLATGGSAILLSTPNGVGGQYYKLWTEAEGGTNSFNPIRLPWWVHPEHDQAWFEKETRNLTKRNIAQEYLCDFVSSGDTFLQSSEFDKLRASLQQPLRKESHQSGVWIWEEPNPDGRYIISADVARGDATDYSAFHVINYDSGNVAAEFMGKISPDRFAELLSEYGMIFNKAVVCPENNTFGYFTCCKLRDLEYPRLYYSSMKDTDLFEYHPPSDALPGFATQTKSRTQALAKLEELLRNGRLISHSQRLYDQMQAFIWDGAKAQASNGANDDLVMSLAIGAWLLGSSTQKVIAKNADMAAALLRAVSRDGRSLGNIPGGPTEVSLPKSIRDNYGIYTTRSSLRQNTIIVPGMKDLSWLYK